MLIDTPEAFEKIKPELLGCLNPVVDTETNGLNAWGTLHSAPHRIIGLSIDTVKGAYYFPYRHLVGQNLPMATFEFFRPYLSNPDRVIGGFNYKFDMHMLFQDGVPYAPNIEDAMLSAHLLNENEPEFKLKVLGDKYLSGKASAEETALLARLRTLGGGKADMHLLTPAEVEPYACDDVRITRALLELHRPALHYWKLYDIWKQICFYEVITAKIESRGILLDLDLMAQYAEEAKAHITEALATLTQLPETGLRLARGGLVGRGNLGRSGRP
jgi:DNA polymerase-1